MSAVDERNNRVVDIYLLERDLDVLRNHFDRVSLQITTAQRQFHSMFVLESFKRIWFSMYKDSGRKLDAFLLSDNQPTNLSSSKFRKHYKRSFTPVNKDEHGWSLDFWALIDKYSQQFISMQRSFADLEIRLLDLENRSCTKRFYLERNVDDIPNFSREDAKEFLIHERFKQHISDLSASIVKLSESIVEVMIQFYSFSRYLFKTYNMKFGMERSIMSLVTDVVDKQYQLPVFIDEFLSSLPSRVYSNDLSLTLRDHLIYNYVRHAGEMNSALTEFLQQSATFNVEYSKRVESDSKHRDLMFQLRYSRELYSHVKHLPHLGFSSYEHKRITKFIPSAASLFHLALSPALAGYVYSVDSRDVLLLAIQQHFDQLEADLRHQTEHIAAADSMLHFGFPSNSAYLSALYNYYSNFEYIITLYAKTSMGADAHDVFRYLESYFNALFLEKYILPVMFAYEDANFVFPSLDSETSEFPSFSTKAEQGMTTVDIGLREYPIINRLAVGIYRHGEFRPMILQNMSKPDDFTVTANPLDLSFTEVFADKSDPISYNPFSGKQ